MPQRTYTPTIEILGNRQATQYQITRQTWHATGLVPMPAAGPAGETCIFVRQHAPYEMEVITWVATCEGGPPQPPSPYGPDCLFGLNDNRVLIDMKFSAIVPTPQGGGTDGHVWSMGGTYVYAKVQPEFGGGDMNVMPLGRMFYETQKTTDNYIPAASFLQDVVDSNFPKPVFPMPGATASTTRGP